jgi:hypothetical protein
MCGVSGEVESLLRYTSNQQLPCWSQCQSHSLIARALWAESCLSSFTIVRRDFISDTKNCVGETSTKLSPKLTHCKPTIARKWKQNLDEVGHESEPESSESRGFCFASQKLFWKNQLDTSIFEFNTTADNQTQPVKKAYDSLISLRNTTDRVI